MNLLTDLITIINVCLINQSISIHAADTVQTEEVSVAPGLNLQEDVASKLNGHASQNEASIGP